MSHDDDVIGIMLNATPLCGSIWDREGRSLDCNDAALHFFGLACKQSWRDRHAELSPEYQPGGEPSGPLLLAHLRRAFAEGRIECPWLHRRADGRLIPVRLILTRVRHAGDEWVVAHAIEQPDPLPADTAIGDGNARARLILDNAPMACNFWDENGDIIDCNLAALRMFGLDSKAELIVRAHELTPEYQPCGGRSEALRRQYARQALQTGRLTLPIPWMRRTVTGEPLPSETTLIRVLEDGRPMLAVFVRDLREEMKLQAEKQEADERMQIMLDTTPLGCTFWDEDGRPIDCNQALLRLFGVSSKQALLHDYPKLAPVYQPNGQLSAELRRQYFQQAQRDGYAQFEWMCQTLAGDPFPSEVTLVRVRRAQGHNIVVYIRDLREEMKLQAEKQEANEYQQLMLDATPLSCSLWNEAHEPIACNQAAVSLFGLGSKQEYLARFHELSPEYQPGGRRSRELMHENVSTAFREGHTSFEWMHKQLDDAPIPVDVTLVRVAHGGGFIVAGYTRDLRELKQTASGLKRMETLAYTDKLTGIGNRLHFLEHATNALAHLSSGGSASLLLLDIDHFKRVNDTHGHSAGDVILQSVAARIRATLRPDDLFARYGGEEFVILLARSGLDAALPLAERVRETLAQSPFEYRGQLINITISIGVSSCDSEATPLQALFDQADTALYKAKRHGRNRVEHGHPDEGGKHG